MLVTKVGSEFRVTTPDNSLQDQPEVAALADGRFVVAWQDYNPPPGATFSASEVRARIFNPDGTPSGAEFLVNTTQASIQNYPAVAGLSDGRFVVAFADQSGAGPGDTSGAVRAQLFNVDGSRAGG